MHIRINDVTVSPTRVDELGEVLANKALPVVAAQGGYRGLLCAADRATGECNIVSFWDSLESVDASEKAIASIRSETVDAVGAQLNNISIAEVLREVRVRPSQVGSRTRVVRLRAPAGSAEQLLNFYESEAIPRLESQPGFLNSRLVRQLTDEGAFAAVSHWTDAAVLEASEKSSSTLRERVVETIPGASIEGISTGEIILIELAT